MDQMKLMFNEMLKTRAKELGDAWAERHAKELAAASKELDKALEAFNDACTSFSGQADDVGSVVDAAHDVTVAQGEIERLEYKRDSFTDAALTLAYFDEPKGGKKK